MYLSHDEAQRCHRVSKRYIDTVAACEETAGYSKLEENVERRTWVPPYRRNKKEIRREKLPKLPKLRTPKKNT